MRAAALLFVDVIAEGHPIREPCSKALGLDRPALLERARSQKRALDSAAAFIGHVMIVARASEDACALAREALLEWLDHEHARLELTSEERAFVEG